MNIEITGKYLADLRQAHRLTQEELADYLKISRQAVSKWETGASLPDTETLLNLSKLYNITINEILEPPVIKYISDFEEIIEIDEKLLKDILLSFRACDIAKASMGASPAANALLTQLLPDIDFDRERYMAGNVKIEDVENIHTQIVSAVNIALQDN